MVAFIRIIQSQEKLDTFNKVLEEEREKRLEVRRNDRMKKRMAEAVARKKTEEEREGWSFCNGGQVHVLQ